MLYYKNRGVMKFAKKVSVLSMIFITFFVLFLFFPICHRPQSQPHKNPTSPIVVPEETSPASTENNSSTDTSIQKNTSSSQTMPEIAVNHTSNSAQPDSQKIANVHIKSTAPSFTTRSGITYPLRTYKALSVDTPNDPYANQWWTTNIGLDTAWTVDPGTTQTTVAVIDTGFALNHEEFVNRWSINAGEQGPTTQQAASKLNCSDRSMPLNQSCNLIDDDLDGIVDNETGATTFENISQLNCSDQGLSIDKSCNLVDDDKNGYSDDVTGWDFINYDRSVQAGETNEYGSGTDHATKVSGVLAANGSNSKGIAGVNLYTKILPLQAIDDDSYGNSISVAEAIYYAVGRNVDVINLSLGSDESDDYTRQAIQYAIDSGVIVVAASGNDGCNCMIYPANYPEVIAVGSYNSTGSYSSFSSYGNNLDIIAPGEDIRTATWTRTNQISSYSSSVSGTSFSAPIVSGLLALARSYQPAASWGELTNALLSTSYHDGLSPTNPWGQRIGSGFVRANNLIVRAATPTNTEMRYFFGPAQIATTLGSNRSYDCETTDFPTALMYRIVISNQVFYTIDTLAYVRAIDAGYQTKNIGRTCVGLPSDILTVSRYINLPREIDNIASVKQ